MSSGFLPMMATVAGAVSVYYLWAFKLGLNENTGLLASTAAAGLLSLLFYRLKQRKK